jgi:hypothetical protein
LLAVNDFESLLPNKQLIIVDAPDVTDQILPADKLFVIFF